MGYDYLDWSRYHKKKDLRVFIGNLIFLLLLQVLGRNGPDLELVFFWVSPSCLAMAAVGTEGTKENVEIHMLPASRKDSSLTLLSSNCQPPNRYKPKVHAFNSIPDLLLADLAPTCYFMYETLDWGVWGKFEGKGFRATAWVFICFVQRDVDRPVHAIFEGVLLGHGAALVRTALTECDVLVAD